MSKLEFIIFEFFRSFKACIFKNILLMFMITIGVIMTVITSSYYFDLGKNMEVYSSQDIDNGQWYRAGLSNATEYSISYSSISGCKNIMEYYNYVTNMEGYPMCFAFTQQNVLALWDNVKTSFTDNDIGQFLSDDHKTGPFTGSYNSDVVTFVDLKSINLDYNAFRLFGLKTVEGEGITRHNTLLDGTDDEVPIVVGNNYQGVFTIGDKLELMVNDYIFSCKIIGILEKGAVCPEGGNTRVNDINLDTYIIFPYNIAFKKFEGDLSTLEKYVFWNTLSLRNGANILINDRSDLRKLTDLYLSRANELELAPVVIEGTSLGLTLLGNETKETIRIMLFLTIVIVCFTIYSLLVAICDKAKNNSREYGIYIMNGCSLYMIMGSYIMEILVIMFPSLLISRYVFGNSYLNPGLFDALPIAGVMYGFIAIITFIAIAFVFYILHNIDAEYLIKQEN